MRKPPLQIHLHFRCGSQGKPASSIFLQDFEPAHWWVELAGIIHRAGASTGIRLRIINPQLYRRAFALTAMEMAA